MLRNSDHLTTTTDVWDERLRLTHPGQANWADKPTPIKNKETGEVTMQDTALVSPITKPGDLWTLGSHRLLCGDSSKS